ncbi:MAG TPA: hypothetical protein VD765_12220 [Solirubrobacterales bacterium]|nr:hypothetical protein [Solirubrobacterales bacterium]
MDEEDREQPDPPPPDDESVEDLDREQPDPPPDDEEVDDLDREGRLDPPSRNVARARSSETAHGRRNHSEQHKWRSWAWWALIITTVGVGWALVLATVFVVRNGDRTEELLALVAEGQQQREGTSGDIQQNQKERQAALKAERQHTQTLRAQELSALADQARSNAEARQALADAALAGSRVDQADSEARQADAEAALAQAQTEAQARRANGDTAAGAEAGSTGQLQAQALSTLAVAAEALQAAIKELGNGGPGHCSKSDDLSKPQGNDAGCTTGGTAAPGP